MSREQRRAQTRRSLLAAAEDLFFQDGFGATSLDAIAGRAGLTTGAVYSNFANKEELFLAMLDAAEVTLADLSAAAGEYDSHADRFEALGRSLYRQGPNDPRSVALLLEVHAYAIRSDRSRAALVETTGAAVGELVAELDPLLEAVQARISGAELVALVQAVNDGVSIRRALQPDLADENFHANALRGIGALLDADPAPS